MIMMTTSAVNIRISVMGRRCWIIRSTGCLEKNESPRLPCTARVKPLYILHRHGLVEPQVCCDGLPVGGGETRPVCILRHGVRGQPCQDETQHRDDEQDDEGLSEPAHYIS